MTEDPTTPVTSRPLVSIVVPLKNEEANIAPLVAEIGAALDGKSPFEVICVNYGSRDGTEAELDRLMPPVRWLRHVKHAVNCGQSAAVRSGAAMARGSVFPKLDGDAQNRPQCLPALIQPFVAG